ncbi:MAG: response regulator transcription factor [Saprospiraceae bacterium]|nr:response regulator transcription factor [Saprospiraceae bacterium]
MKSNISLVIADGHFLIRHGLKCLFNRNPAFRLLGEVDNEERLFSLLEEKKPDIVILDPHQKDVFSLETIKRVHKMHPETNFIVISGDWEKSTVYKTLEMGVSCYLTKECDDREILEAVESVSKDERFFCKKILNLIWEKSFGKEDDCTGTPLSAREIEIVKLVACGKITKEIASELKLSPHTVYTHRKNIMRKLKLSSTPELVLYAVNTGLIEAENQKLSA